MKNYANLAFINNKILNFYAESCGGYSINTSYIFYIFIGLGSLLYNSSIVFQSNQIENSWASYGGIYRIILIKFIKGFYMVINL